MDGSDSGLAGTSGRRGAEAHSTTPLWALAGWDIVIPTEITSFPNRTSSGSVRRMNGLAVRILPYVLAFFSSLCIMILELVASRLVARHVGASLSVWTSVI